MTDLSLFTKELKAHINLVQPETLASKDLSQQIKEFGRNGGLVLAGALQRNPSSLTILWGAH